MGWFGDALGWVWDNTAGAVVGAAGGFVWEQVIAGITSWVVDAVAWFVGRVLSLLEDTTQVDLQQDWFVGTGGPYQRVLAVAAVLLVGCVFVGIVQGVISGDGTEALVRVVRALPLSVLGMVTTIQVAQILLQLSDEMSKAVLRGGGDDAKEVMRVLTDTSIFTGQSSFVIVALGLLAIIAALLVWIELILRSGLIYVLIATSPLIFAAVVWPSARGMMRKFAELTLALIFSKVVIAIALSVGASALAGVDNAGHAEAGTSDNVTASAGTLFSGAVIFLLAALAPFLLLRLFPVMEAAVVAHGVSRGPVRAANTAGATAFYMQRLSGHGGSHTAAASANGRHGGGGGSGQGPSGNGSGGGGGPRHAPSGPGSPHAATRASGGPSSAGAAAGGSGHPAAAAALGAREQAQRIPDHLKRGADGLTRPSGAPGPDIERESS